MSEHASRRHTRQPAGRGAIAALGALVLFAVTACSVAPQQSPSPTTAPASAQALVAAIERQLGAGMAAFDPSYPDDDWTAVAAVTYPATPGTSTWRVDLGVGPGPEWTSPEHTCSGSGQVSCMDRDEVRIGWGPAGMLMAASRRSDAMVVATLHRGQDFFDLRKSPQPTQLSALIELATSPDVGLVMPAAAAQTRWTDDPDCAQAQPFDLTIAPAPTTEPAEPVTPQALVALITERIRGTCGFGSSSSTEQSVSGSLYLSAGDTERVSVDVTTDPLTCTGMDACDTRGDLTIGWQFDVPEEYPATVTVTRAIKGGQVQVTHTSAHADAKTRSFPVPLETLVALAQDPRIGLNVDPALNRAGAASALCWRLLTPTRA